LPTEEDPYLGDMEEASTKPENSISEPAIVKDNADDYEQEKKDGVDQHAYYRFRFQFSVKNN